MRKKKIALFPTISNPPTFGVILSLRYIERHFNKIYVVIEDRPKMVKTKQAIEWMQDALDREKKKYDVISNIADFKNLTELPDDLPKFDTIITISTEIFANLISKGYKNVMMIPKIIGWDETYHRIAYERSVILDKINSSIATISDLKIK
jgi:hypothetical protein